MSINDVSVHVTVVAISQSGPGSSAVHPVTKGTTKVEINAWCLDEITAGRTGVCLDRGVRCTKGHRALDNRSGLIDPARTTIPQRCSKKTGQDPGPIRRVYHESKTGTGPNDSSGSGTSRERATGEYGNLNPSSIVDG